MSIVENCESSRVSFTNCVMERMLLDTLEYLIVPSVDMFFGLFAHHIWTSVSFQICLGTLLTA